MTDEELAAAKKHVEDADMLSGVDPCVARALVAEVERLQRIEAAAKAWLQACDDEDASFSAEHRGEDADVVGAMDRCESAKDQLRAALRAAGSGE